MVTKVESGPRSVARRVLVNAPAQEIFGMVVDPHRHPELDRSGTVRDVPIKGPHRLSVGDKFTVGMTQYGLPYRITSTVTRIEDGRIVEWRHPLGHHWRWEFVETSPGVTEVTETFDYSAVKLPILVTGFGMHHKNADGITATLQNLADRFGDRS
jgi:YD repeat-containing protein